MSLEDGFLSWPSASRKTNVHKYFEDMSGFPSCPGCVDGTPFKLLYAPSTNPECYADGTSGSTSKVESLRIPTPVARMLDRLRDDRKRESTKRDKADMEYWERELALKPDHFTPLEQVRLKEKKMGQQFKLPSQQIALQHKQLDLELVKRS